MKKLVLPVVALAVVSFSMPAVAGCWGSKKSTEQVSKPVEEKPSTSTS